MKMRIPRRKGGEFREKEVTRKGGGGSSEGAETEEGH